MGGEIKVSALYYYPIKSCTGWSLESAELNNRGIIHDREFLVVDASNRFVTQREAARMSLIRPYVNDVSLRVEAPSMNPLAVPMAKEGRTLDVIVWGDKCAGVDQGEEIAKWFSEFLEGSFRLVRMPAHFVRKVSPKYAKRPEDQVGFADAYPCLLISEESLADLNSRLREPLPMNRFRPNIVISGGVPYIEDSLKSVRIGAVVFGVVKPCARCVITTIDQSTGVQGKEPLATLAKYRKTKKGVMFGQNIIHDKSGIIKVGDVVEVLEYCPS